MKNHSVAWILAFTWGGASAPQALADLEIGKSLLITTPQVVDSEGARPHGEFGFSHLLSRLVPPGQTAERFVRAWLGEWEKTEFQGFELTPRPAKRLLDLWPRDDLSHLILTRAPFRLLAIVNRVDLVDPFSADAEKDFGELRFVYGAIDPSNQRPLEFTVIFEYHLPYLSQLTSRQEWAQAFAALSELPMGPAYIQRLAGLTRRVASNISARRYFARLRTNDFYLAPLWELREFQLASDGMLRLAPTGQTPAMHFNSTEHSGELTAWLYENQESVEQGRAKFPEHFLGGNALASRDSFSWLQGQGLPETLRLAFSRNTCNGCHVADTRTIFTHIKPRTSGTASRLSEFLKSELAQRLQTLKELTQSSSFGP